MWKWTGHCGLHINDKGNKRGNVHLFSGTCCLSIRMWNVLILTNPKQARPIWLGAEEKNLEAFQIFEKPLLHRNKYICRKRSNTMRLKMAELACTWYMNHHGCLWKRSLFFKQNGDSWSVGQLLVSEWRSMVQNYGYLRHLLYCAYDRTSWFVLIYLGMNHAYKLAIF